MDLVLQLLVAPIITWVGLLVVVPIAQQIADFPLPPLGEMAWKLGATIAAANTVMVVLAFVHGFLAWVASVLVFWGAMFQIFDLDAFGAVVIAVLWWLLRVFVVVAILTAVVG